MAKKIALLLSAALLFTPAHALPLHAITEFFSKIAKGVAGHVDDVAQTAGKVAEDIHPTKSAGHPVPDLPKDGTMKPELGRAAATTSNAIDPKYRLVDPVSSSAVDRETYKRLRAAALGGDADAMIRMADMTRRMQVVDHGEPHYSYWLFHAARMGSQQAKIKFQAVCSEDKEMRKIDRHFDQICSNSK